MKRKVLSGFIVAFFTCATFAQNNDINDNRPSHHGMIIFGKDRLYASYLSSFHAPHNYQVLLELELDSVIQKRLLFDQQLHPEFATYSMRTEELVLQEMIKNPKSFKADIHRGHFEKVDMKIDTNVTVRIKKVIYFHKLSPDERKDFIGTYILFGNQKEQFAVHMLGNKPDFEQIIQIQSSYLFSPDTAKAFSKIYLNVENAPVGVSGNMLKVNEGDKEIEFVLTRQIYLEFTALKH